MSFVVLLELPVRIYPDSQAACRLSVELYEPFPDHYLPCYVSPEVFVVASSSCE